MRRDAGQTKQPSGLTLQYFLLDGAGVALLVVAALAWSNGLSTVAWVVPGVLGVALIGLAIRHFLRIRRKQSET